MPISEVRFTKAWIDRASPITVKFGEDSPSNGIIIRLTKSWVDRVSPILIRFGDSSVEPPTPLDKAIGIECGLIWDKPIELHVNAELVESAFHFETQLMCNWTMPVIVSNSISIFWHLKDSHQVGYSMSWFIMGETRTGFSLNWTTPTDYVITKSVNWIDGAESTNINLINWIDVNLIYTNRAINWVDGVINHYVLEFKYHGIAVDNAHYIKWCFPPSKWICSTKYRLPVIGIIKIRFSEQFNNQIIPARLRFTASLEYCYFDDGGGSLNPFPDLPDLDFNIPIEPQLRRYYLMQPTITCVRMSDNVPIVISSISISRSRGQWASSVNMDFSSRIDATRAENQLLKIGINGYEFFAYIEQLSCSKVFGSQTYTGTGRSRSAELASPYVLPTSYTNATSLSFAGLLSNILQFTDWTVALNGIVDFNVPAGAFSVGNKSPIEQVQEAVSQLGCMLLCDDATQTLTVVPRWPTSPWMMDGAAPDITVHDAVITSYSESKEIGTECNVVWLRGEQQGISAKVKRAGSAGNIATDDISAQLIVDNQAARTAGTNALADTGNKLNINMSLPIMADLPPLTPGMLVGVREGVEVFKGTCDSVSISASVSNTGDIDIEQSITVVRHVA